MSAVPAMSCKWPEFLLAEQQLKYPGFLRVDCEYSQNWSWRPDSRKRRKLFAGVRKAIEESREEAELWNRWEPWRQSENSCSKPEWESADQWSAWRNVRKLLCARTTELSAFEGLWESPVKPLSRQLELTDCPSVKRELSGLPLNPQGCSTQHLHV